MPQPEFARWINPVLQALQELGGTARPREVVERVARNEVVPDVVLDQVNLAGGPRFPNQVHWARFFLAEADLIDRSRSGVWKLTPKGAAVGKLTAAQIEELVTTVREASRSKTQAAQAQTLPSERDAVISTESLSAVFADDLTASDTPAPEGDTRDYRQKMKATLLSLSPGGFERLCQRLLREAGFEEVVVTGRSGDGGIDGRGLLALNAFVTFRVLFQCKRYQGAVTPEKVRDFRGAIQGRADKGIILTTGTFSAEARREAGRDGAPPIELVDVEKLVDLFAELELGLKPVKTFELVDTFFDEYR